MVKPQGLGEKTYRVETFVATRRRRMRGMNQAICTRGVEEGVEMALFESWCRLVHIPVIPDYILSEWSSMPAGLRMFARAHLRLGMNH